MASERSVSIPDVKRLGSSRLLGGVGDESSFITDEDLANLGNGYRRDGQLPDEELAPSLVPLGRPDPTQ